MSRGKYTLSNYAVKSFEECIYNAKGEIPPDYPGKEKYDGEIHFANYDENGYDSYGYSAYYKDGTYAGIGEGVDIDGWTEMDYLSRNDLDEFSRGQFYGKY